MMGATFKSFRKLTTAGATVIVIHHTNKDGSADYRGASSMAGAVDVGLKMEGTIEEGQLTRMTVKVFKTRLGDGKPVTYGMSNGVPVMETTTYQDRLYELLTRNQGMSKEQFETIAMKNGYRRSTIRHFLDNNIAAGRIQYDKCRLHVKQPGAKAAIALRISEGELHA
jgi:hypothetical protein